MKIKLSDTELEVQWFDSHNRAVVSIGKVVTSLDNSFFEAMDNLILNKIHDMDSLETFLAENPEVTHLKTAFSCGRESALLLLCMAMELKTHSNVNITTNVIVQLLKEERDERWYGRFSEAYLDLSIPFSYNSGS